MNEIIFFFQIFLIGGFAFWALRLGKEALFAWISLQAIIANVFVLKQIDLFGLTVTASDAYSIGSLLGLNFLQEYYHREDAKRASWICFFFMLFFALATQIHLLFQPSPEDYAQPAYETILSLSPRLVIASMLVFFVVQKFDIFFFSLVKAKLPNLSFVWRSFICLVVSQFLDTFLFSFAGLYGIVSSMIGIITLSFLIKLIVITSLSSLMRIIKT